MRVSSSQRNSQHARLRPRLATPWNTGEGQVAAIISETIIEKSAQMFFQRDISVCATHRSFLQVARRESQVSWLVWNLRPKSSSIAACS